MVQHLIRVEFNLRRTGVPEIPPQDDPITSRPMSLLVLISVFILLLTVAWSLYAEFFGLRPWRSYQDRFRERLFRLISESRSSQRKADEQSFLRHARLSEAEGGRASGHATAAAPMDRQIQAQIDLLDRQRAAMTDRFQTSRGKVGALTYQLEQIPESDKSAKASKLKDLNAAKAETYSVDWPDAKACDRAAKISTDDLAEWHVHQHHGNPRPHWSRSAAMWTSPPRTRRPRSTNT